jgi:hypothetical protein
VRDSFSLFLLGTGSDIDTDTGTDSDTLEITPRAITTLG